MTLKFDENGLVIEAGNIRCFYYDAESKEYTGWSDEFINVGVSMPSNSTDIDPGDEIAGEVAIFNGNGWEQRKDFRGNIAYSIEDRIVSTVDYIGDIKEGFTIAAPATPYDKWDGTAWIADAEAEQAAEKAANEVIKSQLRNAADEEINWRQDAIDADIATDKEAGDLTEWKKYRVLLMRVDTTKPEWPTPPTE